MTKTFSESFCFKEMQHKGSILPSTVCVCACMCAVSSVKQEKAGDQYDNIERSSSSITLINK